MPGKKPYEKPTITEIPIDGPLVRQAYTAELDLLDRFAAAALAGIMAQPDADRADDDELASWAWDLALEMMKQRRTAYSAFVQWHEKIRK